MKKHVLAIFVVVMAFFSFRADAQQQRTCGSMDYLNQQLQQDPGLAQRMQDIEQYTAAYVAQQQSKNGNRINSVITIPVVFHIVYNTTSQNITDAKCLAQLNQLNLDFAKMNTDASLIPSAFTASAANTNIQFCLASRTPTGASSTGIERRQTTVSAFSTNDAVKYYANGGLDAWPAASYLNIWVCNMSGGILGYAQFPGGAAATDGVVLQFSTVGSMLSPGSGAPYNLGRTATHEVGHWLNLRHIWGDANCGSDLVNDTPTHKTANYGCPTYPYTGGCTGTTAEMTMNYMDYTDDNCMYMFTNGQSARMNALFASGGARIGLLSSTGCTAVSSCGVPTGVTVSNVSTSGATISWVSVTGATSYNVTYCVAGTTSCTTTSSTGNSITISNLSPGTTYTYSIQAVCSNGTSTAATGTFATVATSCGNPTNLITSSITSTGVTLGWTAVSGAVSYNIQYRKSTVTTWTTTTSTTASKAITGLSASTAYVWQVQAVCNGLAGTYVAGPNFTTAAGACTDAYESNNSLSTAKTIATNTNITALISSSTDKDYFKFTTTSPNTNIRIDLSNLPADYDVRLYSSTGTQLAISQQSGTTSEVIIRNTTAAATYTVYVYGYNGAFNASTCYTLRVSTGSVAFRSTQDANGNIEESFSDLTANELNLFPNPARNEVNVFYNADQAATMNLQIIDMVGKTVYDRQVSVVAGINKFGVDLADLTKGIYFVALYNGENREVKKLVVDR